jgi:biotin carboxylase
MERFDGKTLIFLDGSAVAIPAVERAKELGIKTIVANYYDELRSPAKAHADIALKADFTDLDGLVEICKENKVDGMFQGWTDSHLPVYAVLCERMSWPCYGTKEQFEICANKDLFKQTCIRYGVPVAKEYSLCFDDEHLVGIENVTLPVIVKPTDSSGSRGVYVCRTIDELEENYRKAWDISPSHSVAVEDYLVGQHVNIYYTLSKGNIYLSAMCDRYVDYHDGVGAPMPVCLIHPSQFLSEFEEEVDPKLKDMFRGMGMKDGIAFVQGFHCDNGTFAIYEMGYRPNGGATYSLIDACSGYNQLDMLIRFALTGAMGEEEKLKVQTPHFKKIAVNYVISTKNVNIIRGGVRGLDAVRKLPEVVDVVQKEYGGNQSSGTRPHDIAFVLMVVDSYEQLNTVLRKIKALVTIESVDEGYLPIASFDAVNKTVQGCMEQ